MDWLYRIFYTVVSMGVLMVALLPIVVAVRFLLRNRGKKYMMWEWKIFYLRSICPIAMSSIFCIVPAWNRKYHILLDSLGLSVEQGGGIMHSWSAVFLGEISVQATFKICSVIWIFGMAGMLVLIFFSQLGLKRYLKETTGLGENIYEVNQIAVPVRTGIFHKKVYLPEGFQTKETAWLLRHFKAYRFYGVKNVLVCLITAIHWFNPAMWLYYYWWKADADMVADDRAVRGETEETRREYAQCILNFRKDGEKGEKRKSFQGAIFFTQIAERNTEKRASRMLYQKTARMSDGLVAVFYFSLTLTFCFLLVPMKTIWQKGISGGTVVESEGEPIFQENNTVVAKVKTVSPEGLDQIVQLEMLSGKEEENYYEGEFILRMYGLAEDEIASCRVRDLFPEMQEGTQRFNKNMALCVHDYNGDGTQELVIGQQAKVPKKIKSSDSSDMLEAYTYAVLNLENKAIPVICGNILAVAPKPQLSESVIFEMPKKIDDIFLVPKAEKMQYYVWDERKSTYQKQKMTKKQLEEYRKGIKNSAEGETQEHTLDNKEKEICILVSTKKDDTQNEAIQSVTLFPRTNAKKFKGIHGYYCDLLWVPDRGDGQEERYAQLIYNGTKSQTFILYDTVNRIVYYKHEDGSEQLASIFQQYQQDDITFQDNGSVTYSLLEKNGDVLTIQFAADAENGIVVQGSFAYDVKKKSVSNFTYSRIEER